MKHQNVLENLKKSNAKLSNYYLLIELICCEVKKINILKTNGKSVYSSRNPYCNQLL